MFEPFKIRIPATTANLGPGFDIIGAALNHYNYISVFPSDIDKINLSGTENKNIISTKDNLIYKSMLHVFKRLDIEIPNMELNIEVNIPLSRGLGSSSSAIVGGIFAANVICNNRLSLNELVTIANEIEGHPDNIAPCLLGGIIISLAENNQVYTQKIETALPLKFIVVIPEFELSTEKARKILPEKVPFKDAVFNASHLAFLINSLITGDIRLLGISLRDRLHEQYRGQLINGFKDITDIALKNGAIGSVLSGAGPTILALATENEEQIGKAMQETWLSHNISSSYKVLKLNNEGTIKL
jgi:homoserine kinase